MKRERLTRQRKIENGNIFASRQGEVAAVCTELKKHTDVHFSADMGNGRAVHIDPTKMATRSTGKDYIRHIDLDALIKELRRVAAMPSITKDRP